MSWNVNGLRAAWKSGLAELLDTNGADVVCLQEIKAQPSDVPSAIHDRSGYHLHINSGARRGHAGVAILTREPVEPFACPLDVGGFGDEGRILAATVSGILVVNLYLPHGGRDGARIPYKLEVYDALRRFAEGLTNVPALLVGDFNVAAADIDLARSRENRKNTMFSPAERDALHALLDGGWTDTFRERNPGATDAYTWWPYSHRARERNIGWRIDYVLASRAIRDRIEQAFILTDTRGSDHCPVGVEVLVEL